MNRTTKTYRFSLSSPPLLTSFLFSKYKYNNIHIRGNQGRQWEKNRSGNLVFLFFFGSSPFPLFTRVCLLHFLLSLSPPSIDFSNFASLFSYTAFFFSYPALPPFSLTLPVFCLTLPVRHVTGNDQDYLRESQERLFRYLRFSKRATVGVRATYATR